MKLRLFPSSCSERRAASRYAGLELLATAVLLLDARAARSRYANPAAENLFELSRAKLVGQPPRADLRRCAALVRGDRQGASRRGASYTEQELELGATGKPRLHLTCTVIAGRRATIARCCSSSATSTSS